MAAVESSASTRVEWVEIIEPRTKERMYANLATGECVWDPPSGVAVKKTDENQWWELFDPNTSRFYYYNASSQQTVWHRPQHSDIIPLAKLQTLKQNTEVGYDAAKPPVRKESVGTQTPLRPAPKTDSFVCGGGVTQRTVSSQTQTTPPSSPLEKRKHTHRGSPTRCRHHHHHHHHHHHRRHDEQRLTAPVNSNNVNEGSGTRTNWKNKDSGRSSDSSSISHSHSSLESSGRLYHMLESSRGEPSQAVNWLDGLQKSKVPSPPGLAGSRRLLAASPPQPMLATSPVDFSSFVDQYLLGNPMPSLSPPLNFRSERKVGAPKQRSLETDGRRVDVGKLGRMDASFHKESSAGQVSRSHSFTQRRDTDPDAMHEVFLVLPRREMSRHADHLLLPRERTHRKQWSLDMDVHHDHHDAKPPVYRPSTYRSPTESDSSSPSSPAADRHPHHHILLSASTSHSKLTGGDSSSPLDSGIASISTGGGLGTTGSIPRSHSHDTDSKRSKRSRGNKENWHVGAASPGYGSAHHQHLTDATHLYTNVDSWDLTCPQLLPLQQFILEQAQLSGYRIGDPLDHDSLTQSDDSDGNDYNDEDEDFADDEAMSNAESSSLEYLPDTHHYLEETYANLLHTSGGGKRDGADSGAPYHALPLPHRRKPDPLPPPHKPPPPPPPEGVIHAAECLPRPVSLMVPTRSDGPQPPPNHLLHKDRKQTSESDIEKYAQDNLNIHTKGLFRKKFSLRDMLSWSKDPIRKPMILTTDKAIKKDACEVFKLIQIYMADRKAKPGMTVAGVALDITTRGWSKAPLRDELYVQICRQTTDNPRRDSLRRGWELLAICLAFFPPSVKFLPYLSGYIGRHRDSAFDTLEVQISHYAGVCSKRLERIAQNGAKKGLRKPTVEEIDLCRLHIFRPSMFGNTLEEVMSIQRDLFPHRRLPWVQTVLSMEVLKLDGARTEGIFRVPGDIDEVNAMKLRLDQWDVPVTADPHVPASLLKLWYRELWEPLIPASLYQECVDHPDDAAAMRSIVERLPDINRLVLAYLVRFLQVFASPENVALTKMDANNLAMVMAPNCLRCESDDPRVIFENTRKEMAFVRTLIQNLDTSYVEGVV